MPLLDVSEVLLDPMFSEVLTVIRSAQTVGSNGMASVTEETLNPVGVVTAGSPEGLSRSPDGEFTANAITVHSTLPLRELAQGRDADIVIWNGNRYVVKKTLDWSKYGAGFTASVCEMLPLATA